MYRVAILGCENSHANCFLDAVLKNKLVDDVEFVGVYSDDKEAAELLKKEYGVYVAESCDEFVGKVDGVMITARHGDNHYKYAKPYIESGIPMFIDKPITCSEEDAKAFKKELEEHQIPVSGGSVCALAGYVQELKEAVAEQKYGKVYGGFLRAPIDMENPYGDFFFYSQHLVQVMMEIFGCYPNSVQVFHKGEAYSCVVRYKDYDVTIQFVDHNYLYYASVSCSEKVVGSDYGIMDCFDKEFLNYYHILTNRQQKVSYDDFFAPVAVLNAIYRSMESGKEEEVHRF